MATLGAEAEAAVEAVQSWAASLPNGVVDLHEEDLSHEYVLDVHPQNERAVCISFRFSEYGTFGLYVGEGIRIEDLPVSAPYVLEICHAVSAGQVEEERWSRNGRARKVANTLHLPSGDLHGTALLRVFGALGHNEHDQWRYEPYDVEVPPN